MAYPYEQGEAERFVPPSLADLDNPPTFWLRNGTLRERDRQDDLMALLGLKLHDIEEMRQEILEGMRNLLSPERYATFEPKAKSYWQARDAYELEHRNVPLSERPKFEFDGENLILETLASISEDWFPVRKMDRDNRKTNRLLPHIINSVIIERYENVDVPVQTERVRYGDKVFEYLTVDCARYVDQELNDIARENGVDADPCEELRIECLLKLFLGKEREKNSASPAPSTPTPPDSRTGAESANGPSQALEPSPKTRAGSSAKRNTR